MLSGCARNWGEMKSPPFIKRGHHSSASAPGCGGEMRNHLSDIMKKHPNLFLMKISNFLTLLQTKQNIIMN